MFAQIGQAGFHRGGIGGGEVFELDPSMHLERADGCHQNHGIGAEPAIFADDIEKLFRAQVEAEARFGDSVFRQPQRALGGKYAVGALGDVGKGAAVHEGGCVFGGLHDVWFEGVLEQGGDGAFIAQLPHIDRFSVEGEAHGDIADALLELVHVVCQAEDGHDLAGGGDVETVFAGEALLAAAEADDDLAQHAVVHVQHPFPGHAAGIDIERVIKINMVVHQCREGVVGGGDGMEVAREVEVDVLHRQHLAPASAGSSALDAKHWAQ